MRDGEIVQSGKYNNLLGSGTDFEALVAAHNEALQLVEMDEDEEECVDDVALPVSPRPEKANLTRSLSSFKRLENSGLGGRYDLSL